MCIQKRYLLTKFNYTKTRICQNLKVLEKMFNIGILHYMQNLIAENEAFGKIMTNEYGPIYLIALLLSVIWNFTFNRKFTFKSASNIPVAMLKVALFYCVFAPLSTWWTHALTPHLNAYVIEIGTMAVNLIPEYLYCRFVVYRNSMNTNKLAEKDKEKAESK